MSVKVTHADSGLVHAEVVRSDLVTPHMARVTLGGDDLDRFVSLGFDQWVRLAIPTSADTRFDNLADSFGMAGYIRFLTLPKGTRPVIRNYTVRAARPELRELDIDFVVHGEDGVAGPWARSVSPGTPVALIDQGCGYAPVPADWTLLMCDESGFPAVAGILRDLPRTATGHAVIELFDRADRQDTGAPDGVTVHWVTRSPGTDPGTAALPALRSMWAGERLDGVPYAFVVGEQALASSARRFLVSECGVPKRHVTFSGYWRLGKAYPT